MAGSDAPDYAHMSGGEFKHAVGCDPEQWAEAFLQREIDEPSDVSREGQKRILTGWFTDVIEAARVDERRHKIG